MRIVGRRTPYAGRFAESSKELWQLAVELELEGIIAKRADGPYKAWPSPAWQKVKTDLGAERERLRRPA